MRIPIHKQLMWWGVAAVTLLLAMWLLGNAILPFILGAGVAYLLDPVADRLERAGLSRVMSVVVISVAAVLVKLFADRQQSVPADLIDWLVLHMPRDLGLARQLVAAMDRAAMADKRPITRRIAAELLNGLSESET